MTHDDAIERLFHEYKVADKRRYTDIFLSALTDSKFNSGLYVYAVMKTFQNHCFTQRNDGVNPKLYESWTDEDKSHYHRTEPCLICSAYRHDISSGEWQGISMDVWYDKFYFIGGISVTDIYKMLYIMQRINHSEKIPRVKEQDFIMFKEIMSYLQNAEPDAKIRDILKQLKKTSVFKSLVRQMRADGIGISEGVTLAATEKAKFILGTLGVCGILHTEKYKGPFYEYTNLAVAPRSSHSSDWPYPVDFWKGNDGIDWEAFDYWFSDYKELENIRK